MWGGGAPCWGPCGHPLFYRRDLGQRHLQDEVLPCICASLGTRTSRTPVPAVPRAPLRAPQPVGAWSRLPGPAPGELAHGNHSNWFCAHHPSLHPDTGPLWPFSGLRLLSYSNKAHQCQGKEQSISHSGMCFGINKKPRGHYCKPCALTHVYYYCVFTAQHTYRRMVFLFLGRKTALWRISSSPGNLFQLSCSHQWLWLNSWRISWLRNVRYQHFPLILLTSATHKLPVLWSSSHYLQPYN